DAPVSRNARVEMPPRSGGSFCLPGPSRRPRGAALGGGALVLFLAPLDLGFPLVVADAPEFISRIRDGICSIADRLAHIAQHVAAHARVTAAGPIVVGVLGPAPFVVVVVVPVGIGKVGVREIEHEIAYRLQGPDVGARPGAYRGVGQPVYVAYDCLKLSPIVPAPPLALPLSGPVPLLF